MSCSEVNVKKISGRRDVGNTSFSAVEKFKIISQKMLDKSSLLYQALQMGDVRVDVHQDSEGKYSVLESVKERDGGNTPKYDTTDAEEQIAQMSMSKAFHSPTDKHKIATTAIVNDIIASIPYIDNTPDTKNLKTSVYSFSEMLPITKTRQLLYKLHTIAATTPNTESLKNIIWNNILANKTDINDQRILVSLYNYFYSDTPTNYVNLLGDNFSMESLEVKSQNSKSDTIATRSMNYLTLFHSAIVSINDKSSLMIVGDKQNSVVNSDENLVVRMGTVNSVQANNLFEIEETYDQSKGKDVAVIKVKNSIVKAFKAKVSIQSGQDFKQIVFKANGVTIVIPFALSQDKAALVDVGDFFGELLQITRARVTQEVQGNKLSLTEEDNEKIEQKIAEFIDKTVLNKDVLNEILDTLGYKGVISGNTLDYILQSVGDNKVDAQFRRQGNINELFKLIASGVVSLSINLEQSKPQSEKHVFVSEYIYKPFLKDLKETFASTNFDNHPFNIKETIMKSSLIQEGLQPKEFDSMIMSPIGFWKSADWLTTQIRGANNLSASTAQYNTEAERVESNNIASNSERITKVIGSIKSAIFKGINSVFSHNIFVKNDAVITDIYNLDGYIGEDGIGKSQMSMNETDLAGVLHLSYANSMFKEYDKVKKVLRTALTIPQTYADKGKWTGFLTRMQGHNFFPTSLAGDKKRYFHTELLVKREIDNRKENNLALVRNFLNEWNNMYYVDPATGAKVAMPYPKSNVEALINNPTALNNYIDGIRISFDKKPPISATKNKYYDINETEDGKFLLTINHNLKNQIQKIHLTDYGHKREILANLAWNHNRLVNFSADPNTKNKFNKDINDRLLAVLGENNKVELGVEGNLNLELFFQHQEKDGKRVVLFSKDGDPVLNTSIFNDPIAEEQAITAMYAEIRKLHPLEQSQFFAHNLTYHHINDLLVGSKFQYKNKTMSEMLGDMLKRAVMAASPGITMSVDTNLVRKLRDLRIPQFSKVICINDLKEESLVLGTGGTESVDIIDGGSFTTALAEIMYQASFGGTRGLMPNSALKFFYAAVDIVKGAAKLIKYAGHVINEEQMNVGTERLTQLVRLQLGAMSLGRVVNFKGITDNGIMIVPPRVFTESESLWEIFSHIKENKDNAKSTLDSFQLVADVIKLNPDLKDRFVHQIIVNSSNKTGQELYHDLEDLTNRLSQDVNFRMGDHEFVELDNVNLTMQLDATHDVEDSIVSKFSQSIANAVLEGRTMDAVEIMYNTLGALVQKRLASVKVVFGEGKFDFEKEFNINSFKLQTVAGFREIYEQKLPIDKEKKALIDLFNEHSKADRVKLFVRATVMSTMEQQKQNNSTYKQLQSNSWDLQEPMTASLVESAVRSYINKQTTALKFSGGNYILAPSAGLYDIRTISNGKETMRVLGKKAVERMVAKGEGWVDVSGGSGNKSRKPDVILPIGTSGSGKSTFIKSLPQENLVVIEPDAMRIEFTGDINDKSKDKEIYIEAAKRAIQAVKQGKQVVFDTTNLTKDKRFPFIEAIKKAIPDANIQYKLMALNPELAKQRIKDQIARGESRANVPDTTIDRHAESYREMLEDIKSESISNFDLQQKPSGDLQWKLATNKADGSSIYETQVWKDFNNLSEGPNKIANTDQRWLDARMALIQELSVEGRWEITPAEIILPCAFKTKFGIVAGMQPCDVTVDYYKSISRYAAEKAKFDNFLKNEPTASPEMRLEWTVKSAELGVKIQEDAEKRFHGFTKSLEVIVGRIPSTGMQSILTAKIVGFIEGNKNTIWFPKELMMIQGADLDIDKAVVLSKWFDENGYYIDDDSDQGLMNQVVQHQIDIATNSKNQVLSDSPVSMDSLKVIRKKIEGLIDKVYGIGNEYLPSTMLLLKILASEGKAMVGVFANQYKAYSLIYYTNWLNTKNGNNTTVKPITIYTGKTVDGQRGEIVELKELANIDPSKATVQMWEFYSQLVNAATDNAKEMILGAIGANVQTGNVICLLANYGYTQEKIFDLLRQDIPQRVFKLIRHSTDITNTSKIPMDIESALKTMFGADVDTLSQNPKYDTEENAMVSTLMTLHKASKELAVLASALSINRELPASNYDAFAYSQKINNYVNEAYSSVKDKNGVSLAEDFDLDKFINPKNDEYREAQKTKYHDNIQISFNMLKVLDETPDIKAYIQSYSYLKEVMADVSDKHDTISKTINAFKKMYHNERFKNITEDEYKSLVRYFEEFVVNKYIRECNMFSDIKMYTNGKESVIDVNNLEHLAQFQFTFPDFMMELIRDPKNQALSSNKFFNSLQINKDSKGVYLRIPNIDNLTQLTQLELQSHLNSFNSNVYYRGVKIPTKEFKKLVFLYSISNSKGKVSTTSFFDLMNPEFKNNYKYTEWLNSHPNVLSKEDFSISIQSNDHINTALTSLLPKHTKADQYVQEVNVTEDWSDEPVKVEQVSYKAVTSKFDKNGQEIKDLKLPAFIKMYFKGSLRTYKLQKLKGFAGKQSFKYSIIKPIYESTMLSVDYKHEQVTHTSQGELQKRITDTEKASEIVTAGQNDSVPLHVNNKGGAKGTHKVYTNIGTINYDFDKGVIKGNINCK